MAETQADAQTGDIVTATLEYLARALVEHADEVRVELADSDRGKVYRLHVHHEDMGRVIGKSGRIARAIRQVTRAAAAREGITAIVEIAE